MLHYIRLSPIPSGGVCRLVPPGESESKLVSETSKYRYGTHTFLDPQAEGCATSPMWEVGYYIQVLDTPMNATLIKREFLQRTMQVC